MAPDYKERLLEYTKEHAVLHGDFTLASGAKATFFFDMKMVTLSAEGAYLVGKVMFDILTDVDVAAVGGLTLGADPIVTAVSVVSYIDRRIRAGQRLAGRDRRGRYNEGRSDAEGHRDCRGGRV
jgi:orotate phosphoribosyltransferase